jgi:TolB-like protein
MIFYSKLLIIIIVIYAPYLNAQMTIAIADFNNNTDEFYLDKWEKSVPDFLKSELSGSKNLTIVERRALESVLQEQALSMTGLVDSTTAQQVGGLVGAQYIISGTINKSGSWTRIDAKIVKVETGQVKSEMVRTSNEAYLDEMIQLLANNIRHNLVGEVDYRKKLEIKPFPTTSFLIATAGIGVATALVHSAYESKLDEYNSAMMLTDNFDDKYDSANGLYKTRSLLVTLTSVALSGTIYCWFRNLSPEEILAADYAAQPVIIPGFVVDDHGEWRANISIHF